MVLSFDKLFTYNEDQCAPHPFDLRELGEKTTSDKIELLHVRISRTLAGLVVHRVGYSSLPVDNHQVGYSMPPNIRSTEIAGLQVFRQPQLHLA